MLLLCAVLAGLPTALPMVHGADDPAAGAAASEQTIIDAVRRAYGLERQYWQHPRAFPTWERLFDHYRQGFSAAIASAMTDYSRSGDGDPATWVPDQVQVTAIDESTALAWFETPPAFAGDSTWGFERYMIVRLRREDDGRWVIYWATDSAEPP